MQQLEAGKLSPDGNDGVFLWLYCRDGEPYAKYLGEGGPTHIPMVFALLRWDGSFGAIGGKVDRGESLREALTRETLEEASFEVPPDAELEPLGTYKVGIWHVHTFCLELAYDELVGLRSKASERTRASPEVAGFNLVHLTRYLPGEQGEPRGVDVFQQNQFCFSAKQALDALRSRIACPLGAAASSNATPSLQA